MNYHIKSADVEGHNIIVIFHIAVPVENNFAEIELKTCLVEDDNFNKVSVLPWVSASDQTGITNGELYEMSYSYNRNHTLTNAINRNNIDSIYSEMVIKIQDELRKKYEFWHYERDIT